MLTGIKQTDRPGPTYAHQQAIRLGKMIWVFGQAGFDQRGNLAGGMEAQMRQCYVNIKKLLEDFGLTLDNVVEEVLFVLDFKTALKSREIVGPELYSPLTQMASTIVTIPSLPTPRQLVEIKIMARKQ